MKYRFIHILLFFLAFSQLKAQENTPSIEDEYVLPFNSLKTKDKIHANFFTGVDMSFSNNHGSSTSLYYSPNISYEVSPRLAISAGMTYVNSEVSNFRTLNDFGYRPFTGNISQYYAHIAARYQLNERLKIGGSIFYSLTDFNSSAFTTNQPKNSFDRVGYSAFFEYKIGENTYLQGEIRINDNHEPPFFNSFGNRGYFYQESPWLGSPFGR